MSADPRDCVGCMHDFGFCAVHGRCSMATDAAALAATVLTGTRLAHSRGVASRAAELVCLRGDVAPVVVETFEALGHLHDIGYAAPTSGMHALDGADFLRRYARWQWAIPHVAWHSTARWEYEARGMVLPQVECPLLSDQRLLWVADFTTSPTGDRIGAQARIDDIRSRYSLDSPVVAALKASLPSMNEALMAVGVDDRVML